MASDDTEGVTNTDKASDTFLLGEQTLDSLEEDAFGHGAHVDTLENIIREVETPWHVALYGTWGSGKSTIVDLLYERIRSQRNEQLGKPETESKASEEPKFADTLCVSLDAWKHAGESLRTELLLDLNSSLQRELDDCFGDKQTVEEGLTTSESERENSSHDGVLTSSEIIDTLYNVQRKKKKQSRPLREAWGNLPGLVKIPGILVLIATVLYLVLFFEILSLPFGDQLQNVFGTAAVIVVTVGLANAFFGLVLDELRKAREDVDIVEATPQKEWSGAYQRLFDSIVAAADEQYRDRRPSSSEGGIDRIVITVDDLDRCQSQSAVDILIALKSFLSHEKCVYIVPCDEDALHKHLEAADEGEYLGDTLNQQNFLAKFFETELEIPEPSDESLSDYFDEQRAEYGRSFDGRALQVLRDAELNTPRRVVRALNRLVVLEELSENRGIVDIETTPEEEGSAEEGDGTSDVTASDTEHERGWSPERAFLAFVSVLQKDYPRFHAEIERDPNLLDEVFTELSGGFSSETRRGLDPLLDEIGVPEARRDTLLGFLTSSRDVAQAVDELEPYLRLSGSSSGPVDVFKARFDRNRVDSLRLTIESYRDMAVAEETVDSEVDGTSTDGENDAQATLNSFVSYVERQVRDETVQFETLPTAIDIADAFGQENQRRIADAVLDAITKEQPGELLGKLELTRLEPILTALPQAETRKLLQLYVRSIVSEDGLRTDNFVSLVEGPGEPLQDDTVQQAFTETVRSAHQRDIVSNETLAEIMATVRTDRPELYTPELVRCK